MYVATQAAGEHKNENVALHLSLFLLFSIDFFYGSQWKIGHTVLLSDVMLHFSEITQTVDCTIR